MSDRASWRGGEIAGDTDWRYTLCPADLAELVAAARELADPIRQGHSTLSDLGPKPVTTAAVHTMAGAIRDQLLDGRGFALVRGLPAGELDLVENSVLYWLIGSQIGTPMHQNAANDVLIRVRDEGKDFDQPGVRAYETNANLEYHTDSSDVVALYCLRPAMEGGTSTIVSSVAVYEEMARRDPELAALMHESWPHLNPVDGAISYEPICARNDAGRLFTRYGRKYAELTGELTARQVAALDLFDAVTREPGFVLNMNFQPGDVQFLNNHVIMHARTDYVDWPEPERRRELLRMWIVFREQFGLPAVFANSGFVSRAVVADVA